MAYTAAHAPQMIVAPKRLRSFFTGLGHAIIAYTERNSRVAEVERLNALSDDELAKLGIARDRIVHHVFSDRFWY
ncbi:MAG: hypothetical protein CVT82_09080 [Alphaproteobacteria bacterium HGW-Alphaproteobacteria-4]|jgi:uncharacterized protein YjiS (DUF1127 family)|nr:MAG: hypothetical protein CVT82_09080 [Alphaproteobacteria bacterium HGW-Alphaproteobacteria-4]